MKKIVPAPSQQGAIADLYANIYCVDVFNSWMVQVDAYEC